MVARIDGGLSAALAEEVSLRRQLVFSPQEVRDAVATTRDMWYLSVYSSLVLLSACLLVMLPRALAKDGGELGMRAATVIVGPRRKMIMIGMAAMSFIGNLLFTVELWISDRRALALLSTCVGWVLPLSLTWSFFTLYVFPTFPLDLARYAREHCLNLAIDWLLLFNPELTPALPWALDRATLEGAKGFPSVTVACVSWVGFVTRETAQLALAVAAMFYRRTEWDSAALGVFAINLLEIALVLRQRCCLAKVSANKHQIPARSVVAEDSKDEFKAARRIAYPELSDLDEAEMVHPFEDSASEASGHRSEHRHEPPEPGIATTHRLNADYLTFPTLSHPRAISLVSGTIVGLRCTDEDGWCEVVTLDGASGYVPARLLDELPADQHQPIQARGVNRSRSFFVRSVTDMLSSAGGSSRHGSRAGGSRFSVWSKSSKNTQTAQSTTQSQA